MYLCDSLPFGTPRRNFPCVTPRCNFIPNILFLKLFLEFALYLNFLNVVYWDSEIVIFSNVYTVPIHILQHMTFLMLWILNLYKYLIKLLKENYQVGLHIERNGCFFKI